MTNTYHSSCFVLMFFFLFYSLLLIYICSQIFFASKTFFFPVQRNSFLLIITQHYLRLYSFYFCLFTVRRFSSFATRKMSYLLSHRQSTHQVLMCVNLVLLFSIFSFSFCSILGQQHKVQCSENEMKVLVALPEKDTRVYLEGLNGYKNEKCEPKIDDNLAVFELSLINFYDCGIIRVVNKLTVSEGDQLI